MNFKKSRTRLVVLGLIGLGLSLPVHARPLNAAKVSRVINDVRLLPDKAPARKAQLNDLVQGQTSLRTGRRSRAEVIFPDTTTTRIGARSVFRYTPGSRTMTVPSGTVLVRTPRGSGTTQIRTMTVNAGISGGGFHTFLLDHDPNRMTKVIAVEGNLTLQRPGGRPFNLPEGHMVVIRPNRPGIPDPLPIHLDRLVRTSPLLSQKMFYPFPGQGIRNAIVRQEKEIRKGKLIRTSFRPKTPGIRNVIDRNHWRFQAQPNRAARPVFTGP